MGRGGARLSPEIIVDAAIRVAARGEPDGLTGRALGAELGADRSAVWRHFTDRDALLLAVGDRLLTMAAAAVPTGLPPRERLQALARSVVTVYTAHPYVGAAIAARTTRGPGEFAVIEMMLTALEEVGLRGEAVTRHQRMLADTILAYAGTLAGYAVLPDHVRAADERAWAGAYATLPADRYPAITRHLPDLARHGSDEVLTALLHALWLSVAASIHPGDPHA
ncbi:TetR/AcrR family transcriptional regulator; helix-turn-helix transcriptional regulator [Actinocorallia sp. API 0066]|uniref:TetR/AcrR family transcriptional regulator n=1 Tax=Actinocorallia sp. API 0066 TaxID=2896846 RepID=UPI001E631E70|nr:TetR/AcrR family transcriptional regulator [Actinocorallia sp. API 0066]MCD0451709.1 TetR/AcrR family transcriptional regulator; helix-turn-helix transcriptional regulator [Actinocorallia sp. API 0066]